MKLLALLIGLVIALNVQAQNIQAFGNNKVDAETKKVKISHLKSGYGISKEKSPQVEIKKISVPAENNKEKKDEKSLRSGNVEKQVIRKSYYKAGFKVESSLDTEYFLNGSTVLE